MQNQLARSGGKGLSLSGVVFQKAMTIAETPAIVDLESTITYGALATSISKHSAALASVGVQPGDRVGVHFNKSAEGFIAMHAAVAVGAVAVPLDPSSPATRLSDICQQMQITVISTHKPLRRSVEALHALHPLRAVVGLDAALQGTEVVGPSEIQGLAGVAPAKVSPDSLAYIVTTSGSTGEPKGIAHTHQSALAYVDMALGTYGLVEGDRVADVAPHHFDVSTLSLWASPFAGATNVVVNEAYQRLPASHSQLLENEAVTVWYGVPFLIQQLVLRGDLANRNLDSLRWMLFGGEVVPPGIIAEMMKHAPNARFGNCFGPAEVNVVSNAIFDSPPDLDRPLSIGFANDQAEFRLIDPTQNSPESSHEVAPGEAGELWAATPQLMDRYWAHDDLNSQVIKVVDGKRFYRTGDLVSADSTGQLAFHGRVDHQVKVRGFRVELEGIEVELESLAQRTKTAESVVVSVLRKDSGEDEIVAGVLGASPDFDGRKFLSGAASILPAHAVPERTVQLSAASYTGSGKLDRRNLRNQAVALAEEKT